MLGGGLLEWSTLFPGDISALARLPAAAVTAAPYGKGTVKNPDDEILRGKTLAGHPCHK